MSCERRCLLFQTRTTHIHATCMCMCVSSSYWALTIMQWEKLERTSRTFQSNLQYNRHRQSTSGSSFREQLYPYFTWVDYSVFTTHKTRRSIFVCDFNAILLQDIMASKREQCLQYVLHSMIHIYSRWELRMFEQKLRFQSESILTQECDFDTKGMWRQVRSPFPLIAFMVDNTINESVTFRYCNASDILSYPG